jgi:uncharacterized protein
MDYTVRENLALASLGARAASDSELDREKGCTPRVIDGVVDSGNRWHSSIATPHPHWVEIKLPKPARIGWVIVHFADPVGAAMEFRGLVRPQGQKEWREVFHVSRQRDPLGWRGAIEPVTTDTFRLEILRSINPVSLNAAQLSEIELCPPGTLTPIPRKQPPRKPWPPGEAMWLPEPQPWKPVPQVVTAPAGGVTLDKLGLYKAAMDKHTAYLLADANIDDMLFRFRKLAGVANPPGSEHGWEKNFPAHAAQFLIGAGNTLRWEESPELRRKMNQLIDGMKALRTPDGRLAAPSGAGEEGYSFMLLAHGLEAAARAGNRDADGLLHAWAAWYRSRIDDRTVLDPRGALIGQNYFAATALLIDYFSPGGTPDDVLIAYDHVYPNWMRQLREHNLDGIWRAANGHSHSAYCYGWLGYLDMYRATGDRRLLEALLGGWEMYRTHWQHPGGTLAICESGDYPPDSLYITPDAHTGEMCSMTWWAKFNYRLHQLFPADDRYMAEVEKVIYNVGLANQMGKAICYHTHLEGQKDSPRGIEHTCCEAVGTYLYSTLPEYIYSIAEDGLLVNLYEPSAIRWTRAGAAIELAQESRFPFDAAVKLRLKATRPVAMKLRVRVPAWANGEMTIRVNGEDAGRGKPGSYVAIDRTWSTGDVVSFTLPLAWRSVLYRGADQIPGKKRYALMYGPVLMAAASPLKQADTAALPAATSFGGRPGRTCAVVIAHDPADPSQWLAPLPGAPLNFRVKDQGVPIVKPYWTVRDGETFTTYPVIGPAESHR